jgi:hypothetical protein
MLERNTDYNNQTLQNRSKKECETYASQYFLSNHWKYRGAHTHLCLPMEKNLSSVQSNFRPRWPGTMTASYLLNEEVEPELATTP